MKLKIAFLSLALLMLLPASQIVAQDKESAAETAQRLRAELIEVQDREAGVRIRLQELDYELKPENIERHFAGVGSVHPEQLREMRHKQLQTEKDHLIVLLDQLAASRTRLESAITTADAAGYQQSALGSAVLTPDQERRTRFVRATRVIAGIALVLIVFGLMGFWVRKRRSPAA